MKFDAPTQKEIKKLQEKFISELKNKTINGIYNGNISCKKVFTSLEAFSFIKEVNGNFDCSDNHLKSLKGAPSRVNGNFICSHNELESLEGVPSSVNGFFDCSYNKLESLKWAPSSVSGYFYCSGNPGKFTKEDIINAQKESKNNISTFKEWVQAFK